MPATPDTSPANVARVLREAGLCAEVLALHERHETQIYAAQRAAVQCRALADALEQQAAVSDPAFRGALTNDEIKRRIAALTDNQLWALASALDECATAECSYCPDPARATLTELLAPTDD